MVCELSLKGLCSIELTYLNRAEDAIFSFFSVSCFHFDKDFRLCLQFFHVSVLNLMTTFSFEPHIESSLKNLTFKLAFYFRSKFNFFF